MPRKGLLCALLIMVRFHFKVVRRYVRLILFVLAFPSTNYQQSGRLFRFTLICADEFYTGMVLLSANRKMG